MSAPELLKAYSDADKALKDFRAANEAVFKEFDRICYVKDKAEENLKDEVAITKIPLSNQTHDVIVHDQTLTVADIETIDRLIAAGKIPADLRAEIVRNVDRPPYIAVREKKLD